MRRNPTERNAAIADPGTAWIIAISREWRKVELRWNGSEFLPFVPSDFFAGSASPFFHSQAGKPIGLDPEAFR